MMNKKLQKAFNDQINKELYSEYLYLAKIYTHRHYECVEEHDMCHGTGVP